MQGAEKNKCTYERETGCCRKLQNKELHSFHSSPDIRVIKSRKRRWAYVQYTRSRWEINTKNF